MKIYFAAAIRAGRDLQPLYEAIVRHLQQNGHVVLSEQVASPTVLADERGITDQQIFTQDVAWIHECDALVAEVTVPSLGVGFEIAYALHHLDKPVLCLCRRGVHLSAMLQGDPAPGLRVVFYDDQAGALRAADSFLTDLSRQLPE